jgi:hypothetical protein
VANAQPKTDPQKPRRDKARSTTGEAGTLLIEPNLRLGPAGYVAEAQVWLVAREAEMEAKNAENELFTLSNDTRNWKPCLGAAQRPRGLMEDRCEAH